jgi:hypothetical protein
MGDLKGKLKRLEALEDQLFEVLTLPGGERVRYQPNKMLDAFAAYMDGREHWLLPYIRQLDTRQGIPGLIRVLEESRELHGS